MSSKLPQLTINQRKYLEMLTGAATGDMELQHALTRALLKGTAGLLPNNTGDMLAQIYKGFKTLVRPTAENIANADGERRSEIRRDLERLRTFDIAGKLDARLEQSKGASVESYSRSAGFSETVPWLAKASEIYNRICVVAFRGPRRTALGTGFLVADDLVLTANHVVDEHISNAVPNGSIVCIFDRTRAGLAETVHQVAMALCNEPGPRGELDSRARRRPRSNELDFALLRLASPAGQDPIGDRLRGSISTVFGAPFCEPRQPLLIIQHPAGQLSSIEVGNVHRDPYVGSQTDPAFPTRLRYHAKTSGGSSGAPCFTWNFDLIAIHQAFTGLAAEEGAVKQGIPLQSILARLDGVAGVPPFWKVNTRSERNSPDKNEIVESRPFASVSGAPESGAPDQIGLKWLGKKVQDDAISNFCSAVKDTVNATAPGGIFSHNDNYAKLDQSYGRFYWLANGFHELNDNFDPSDPVFYYELWFRERRRAETNTCDISIVWHREGERDLRGNKGIDERMTRLGEAAQKQFARDLDAGRLTFARIDEHDANLTVGIRRRLRNIYDPDSGRGWWLETAVEKVANDIIFLKSSVESRLVKIISARKRVPKHR